jgi:protein-tyrosine phosphatase
MSGLRLSRFRPLVRLPLIVVYRVVDTAARQFTGSPIWRFSEITPQVFVGGQHGKGGLQSMARRHIKATVNLRRGFDDRAHGRLAGDYLHLPTRDGYPPTLEQIRQGVAFIDQQVRAGHAVYIHCKIGVGRAPTLAACYLVSQGLAPTEAWSAIRRVRPFIAPLRRQRRLVMEYAATLAQTSAAMTVPASVPPESD